MDQPLPLKDIHLPEAINWWPPAMGWWLLPVFLILLILAARYGYKRMRQKTAVKTAKVLLTQIRQQHPNDEQTLSALSALLRRTAISTDSRDKVAALHGRAWLHYLDHSLSDTPFSQGIGQCLADAHYRPSQPEDTDLDALFSLCERWLKQQGKRS